MRGPAGEPLLELHGRAREVAEHLGLQTWSVSISHGRTHAVAMAVALGEDGQGRGMKILAVSDHELPNFYSPVCRRAIWGCGYGDLAAATWLIITSNTSSAA